MDRRELLKLFPGAVAISIAPVKAGELPTEGISYRGFDIHWRGWFELFNQDTLVGQWVAYHQEIMSKNWVSIYAAYPGGGGQYYPLQMFDIHVHDNQIPVFFSTPEQEKESCRLEALNRLKKHIDEYLGLQ